VLALFTVATVTKFSSDGFKSFNQNATKIVAKTAQNWAHGAKHVLFKIRLWKRCLGDQLLMNASRDITPRSLIAPGAHCDGSCCLLLVASDEDVRQLLQRMLAYFIRNLLVAQIERHPKVLDFAAQFCHFHDSNRPARR
jgi:hypothetical protein